MTRHICMMVDCSGSMNTIAENVYEALLKILLNLQAKDEDILISYGGFNSSYVSCFTRRKAKYLSVLPKPFAAGGTSIAASLYQALHAMTFHKDDDVLFVVATDGQDDNVNNYAENTKRVIRQVQNSVKKYDMLFVSLSQQAAIQRTAQSLGYGARHCVWGTSVASMMNEFVKAVQ